MAVVKSPGLEISASYLPCRERETPIALTIVLLYPYAYHYLLDVYILVATTTCLPTHSTIYLYTCLSCISVHVMNPVVPLLYVCEAAAILCTSVYVAVTHHVYGLGASFCTVPTGAYCIIN